MTKDQAHQRQLRTVGVGNWLVGLCNCGGRPKSRRGRCNNVTVKNTPIEKPDLAIYSQVEQLASGNLPNWDSPDITTNHWLPFRLMQEAKVVVRNLSTTASATNALVHYYISPFGIGTQRQMLATRKINVPAGSQVELFFPLDQSTLDGDPRVGVHIEIEHPYDEHLINNRGSQVHDGSYTSEVGRSHAISIPVLNNTNFSRQIHLSTLPTDIVASISPTSRNFAPHEQIIANLEMDVPAFLSGSSDDVIHRSVTVLGRLSGGELIGGITKLLRIDS
jgi:hypothetical protein